MPSKRTWPLAKAAPEGAGDTWTWTAIDADSKMIVSYFVGGRDGECAMWFVDDLAARLANRVQLTSDGHKAYLEAVEGAFGGDIDYAILHKVYGSSPESTKGRYSLLNASEPRSTASKATQIWSTFQHVLCRAQQSDNADAHAPLYPTDQRFFKESRKPCLCRRASHDVLQFRPAAFQAAHVARNGRWRYRSALGDWRYCCACRE